MTSGGCIAEEGVGIGKLIEGFRLSVISPSARLEVQGEIVTCSYRQSREDLEPRDRNDPRYLYRVNQGGDPAFKRAGLGFVFCFAPQSSERDAGNAGLGESQKGKNS